MKIVIADPIVLTEEYRQRLEELGELEIYDSVPASHDEFVERIRDAEVVIVGRYGINGKALSSAPKLKMISLWQTGFDNVDLEAAAKSEVIVSNVPSYAFDSVAEFVFALSLDLLRRVHLADMNLRKGLFAWKCYIGNQLMSKL
jgi:D-3-phosphoglycerate dehydrogenase